MRNHDDWLKAYMQYTSVAEAPDKYHLFCGISTIAAALGRKCWVDQKKFIWIPNCFIFLVGPPGLVKKSTTIDLGFDLVTEIPGVLVAAQSATLQALIKKMADNSTTTLLDSGDTLTHSSITASIRELGTFLKLDDKNAIQALCALWDGSKRAFDYETKNRGSDIVYNPYLNLIGGTTTSWIKDSLDEHFIGSGLASRSLFVYEEKPRHYDALPARTLRLRGVDDGSNRHKLVEDLYEISNLNGEFVFTDEAEVWFEGWYADIMGEKSQAKYATLRLSDYLARKQTHVVKLAMCLSAAQGNSKQITKAQLEVADAILLQAESDMAYLFGYIGMADLSRHTNDILSIVRSSKMISKKKLWRCMMNRIGNYRVFDDAILAAARADHIQLMVQPDGDMMLIWKGE